MPSNPAPHPLRIVVLMAGHRYGAQVLAALRSRGVVPTAIAVETQTALRTCFRKRTLGGRIAELPLVIPRSLWRRLRPRFRSDLQIGAPIIATGRLNSPRMRADLQRLRPDVMVLAGTGIVSAELLAIPTLGTLNAHPGLLPWVRGNDVVGHSLLNGIALGMTCHLADAGIDTGPVLRRRLLDVSAIEPSLAALDAACLAAAADLLADVVTGIARDRRLPPASPQMERLPLCRWLDSDRRAEVDALARAGRARTLHDRWSPLVDASSSDLPATFAPPATVDDPSHHR